jgi:hypothetical protein
MRHRCKRCMRATGGWGRTPILARADFGTALLVACVGAAIVIGVYFSMAANNQASAAARVGDMASDHSERMRLVFAPAVPVVRAAAATCAEFGVNLTPWDRLGTAMFKVRARRDTHTHAQSPLVRAAASAPAPAPPRACRVTAARWRVPRGCGRSTARGVGRGRGGAHTHLALFR